MNKRPEKEGAKSENKLACDLSNRNIYYQRQVPLGNKIIDILVMGSLFNPMFGRQIAIECAIYNSDGSARLKETEKLRSIIKWSRTDAAKDIDEIWDVLGGSSFPRAYLEELRTMAAPHFRIHIIHYPDEWHEQLERITNQVIA